MVKLGSKVKDTITGFEGVAVGRTEWLYGCTRIGVESCTLHEGKPLVEWFDEQRMEVLSEDQPKISEQNSAEIGGPRRDPQRQADPKA